jgi:hypothetical protein
MVQGLVEVLGRGHHDDGSADGIVHAKLLAQGLVKVPISQSGSPQELITIIGSGTAPIGAVNSNTDGTQRCINVTVPAVTSGATSCVVIERTLHGRRVGIRFRRNNSGTLPPFTVFVDGVPYEVRQTANRRHAATVLAASDFEALFLIADDLGEGPHNVRVVIAGDVIGGSSRSLIFHGWIADRAAGYEPRRGVTLSTSGVVITTTATVPTLTNPSGLIRKMFFHNPDTVTRKVTVSIGSTDIIKVRDIPAGQSDELDFGEPVDAVASSVRWKADAKTTNDVLGYLEEIPG